MTREIFILCLLSLVSVFIVADIYGQTPMSITQPKVNENVPKEKPKPTVKSMEFTNINFVAIKLVSHHEFKNIDFTVTPLARHHEFRNIDFIVVKILDLQKK